MQQENIGSLIRIFRNSLHMTQEELAHHLGITVSTVNRWENGHALPSKMARLGLASLADDRGVAFGEDQSLVGLPDGLAGRRFITALR